MRIPNGKMMLLSMIALALAIGAFWTISTGAVEPAARGHGGHQAVAKEGAAEQAKGCCPAKAATDEGKKGCPMMAAKADGDKAEDAKKCEGEQCQKCPMSPHKKIAELETLINSAHKAAAGGDAQTATAELVKAQAVMTGLKEQMKNCPMGRHAAAPANKLCPIMEGRIDPDKVKPELTRQYKGQTIAFCCAGCPDKWDALTDAEKQARLDAQKTGHDAPAPATRPAHH